MCISGAPPRVSIISINVAAYTAFWSILRAARISHITHIIGGSAHGGHTAARAAFFIARANAQTVKAATAWRGGSSVAGSVMAIIAYQCRSFARAATRHARARLCAASFATRTALFGVHILSSSVPFCSAQHLINSKKQQQAVSIIIARRHGISNLIFISKVERLNHR